MMKHLRKKQLSRYITAALAVGMFGLVPVAYALPVQDTTHTNTAGTAINTATANQMKITGTAANNVMNWKTFSIANGEKVQFDEKNYLNLVRGASKSEINGVLTGEGGGTIYLINPNGILFGSTAQVNVGNLVASTRAIDSVDASGFETTGANPLASVATSAAGDIVNLGKLQTASVVLEDNNITIQNAADITSDGKTALTSEVTAKAAGIITVGHAVTATTTRSFTIGSTTTDKTVHDYANATVTASGYKATALDGTTANAVKESMLVDNVYDLQNMDANLDGNYMLSGNIDASETSSWNAGAGFSPVGDRTNQFAGTFDGANYTISSLYINRPSTSYVGLFGYAGFGSLRNVGLVGGSITGEGNVGSVAGYSHYNTVTNVYNTGTVTAADGVVGGLIGQSSTAIVSNSYNTGAVSGSMQVGGVVGHDSNGSSITNVYNTGAVKGSHAVGGVVGENSNGSSITNAYNTGAVSGTGYIIYNIGGVAGASPDSSITNVYNTGTVSGSGLESGVVGSSRGNATITNTWYATTDANGTAINGTNDSGIGTGRTLAELQSMNLAAYGFDDAAWRTYPTDGSDTLVATTPMLQAFKSTALDSAIAHTAVQYGTAETPLINIYKTSGAVTFDYASLALPDNVGARIMDNALTITNFTPGTGNTSIWSSDTNLTLQNDNGFTINKNMQLIGTDSITLSAKDSSTGTIADYGQNTTKALAITAKDIVLDTDMVNTAAGDAKTTVTLNAAGTAKAGYTPSGTMTATVNGASVSVPDYANAVKRTYYPTVTVNGGVTLSEGQWIKNVTQLQAMGSNTNTLSKTYFLYSDIDASDTKNWNSGAGFSPVGDFNNAFAGTFDGLNYTISSLYIYRPTTVNVGLFGVSRGGNIQNVGMVGGSVTGQTYVGSVAGQYVGDFMTNVYNTGTVSGHDSVGGVVGSFVGQKLTNAYNTGTVSGTDSVGGVVAGAAVNVINAYNTGTVSGSNHVGGVLASDVLSLTNAYNTGTVSGNTVVGGVVGLVEQSTVATLTNAYNTGTVSGTSNVGGVVGQNGYSTTNVYNTGAVSGSDNVGGVVGYNASGTVTNALWANDLTYTPATGSKPTQAVGNEADTDTVKGATLADMKKAATYSSWQGDTGSIVATTGNAGKTWRIYEDYTTPLLTSFFKGVVTVTGIDDQTVTYNGTTQTADVSGAAYSPAGIDTGHILAGGGRNVGTYGLMYSDQQGYDLVTDKTYTLTISPKTLTATLIGDNVFTKVYDGTTAVSQALTLGTTYHLDGILAGDQVSIAANSTGAYNDKNVGDNKTISYSGITLTGTDAGNYTIANTLAGAVGQITSGSQDHNYSDALVGFGSFFDTDPADGMTIFRSNPEDYIPRAVAKNNGQSYQVGVSQVTQTWYNGPTTITIVNGGIALPKDIYLGSTPDNHTVVIKGNNSYLI